MYLPYFSGRHRRDRSRTLVTRHGLRNAAPTGSRFDVLIGRQGWTLSSRNN